MEKKIYHKFNIEGIGNKNVPFSSPPDYQMIIESLTKLGLRRPYLQYRDVDGDLIDVSSNDDLQAAYDCAGEVNKWIVKDTPISNNNYKEKKNQNFNNQKRDFNQSNRLYNNNTKNINNQRSNKQKDKEYQYQPFKNEYEIKGTINKLLAMEPSDLPGVITSSLRMNQIKDIAHGTRTLSDETIEMFIKLLTLQEIRRSLLREKTNGLYSILLSSRFISISLRSYISNLPLKQNSDKLLEPILDLLKEMIDRLPDSHVELPIDTLVNSVNELREKGNLEGSLIQRSTNLDQQRKDIRDSKFKKLEKVISINVDTSYRDIPIYPHPDEFGGPRPVIPTNIGKGKFGDNIHYLDTHFRLLREDCIQPIRNGITDYLCGKKTDLKIYNEVKISGVDFDPRLGMVYIIKFTTRGKINWARSKRLIMGSLVCLTPDNFQTMLWATIADRDIKKLDLNQISIRFPTGYEPNFVIGTTYQMTESSAAYFEAYKHVLQALKEIDPTDLPFTEHLVECKKDVGPPGYLDKNTVFKFSTTFGHMEVGQWPVLQSWPNCLTTLDQTQLNAVKLALTRKLAIIQGPPGTGKTYVGLKIAQLLLNNVKKGPILVICYTNHALDQFLEGINEFEGRIVRVGGRSRSEKLKDKTIYAYELSADNKFNRNERWEIYNKCNRCRDEIDVLAKQLKKTALGTNDLYRIATYEQIINLNNGGGIENWINRKSNKKSRKNKEEVEQINQKVDSDDVGDEEEINKQQEDIFALQGTNEEKYETEIDIVELEDEEIPEQNEIDIEVLIGVENVWELNANQRAVLYNYWLQEYRKIVQQKLNTKFDEYEKYSREFRELSENTQLQILRKAKVVGMTTTGAAKYHRMLQSLGSKIVIVEEAAEVLEAHILTSLTRDTEHLILIGDHFQLRPGVAVDRLGKKNLLAVSMFERLVNNDLEHVTLSCQRRMRPEFSQLILPLYPELTNHPRVEQYENVKSISSNLFFLNHSNFETHENDTLSHRNTFEANHAVKLASYLIKQGYVSSSLTILTTYVGQLLLIKELVKKSTIPTGIKIYSVDNYQGEENDIIILSLVRSNKENKIGFIKEPNRACVALSRAKKGFFCIGNLDFLANNSPFWQQVKRELYNQKNVGDCFSFYCQNHPETQSFVRTTIDWNSISDGGCNKPCEVRVECGHTCTKRCHPDGHDDYKCYKDCERRGKECIGATRTCDHRCIQKCYQECGDCKVLVTKKNPKCGHENRVPCCQDDFKCDLPCNRLLSCKHTCQLLCGDICSVRDCEFPVEKLLACGHRMQVPCSIPIDNVKCTVECTDMLECLHKCAGTCGDCQQGKLHILCKSKCGRKLVCSHECPEPCTKNCPPCYKKCENSCVHGKCEKRCGELCVKCKEPCSWKCEHYQCELLCGDICVRPRCNQPCKKTLKCKHKCVGLCGERCPDVCRVCDPNNEVFQIYFGSEDDINARFIQLEDCKHIIEVDALDQWVDMENSENVQLKVCPKCQVSIRTSLRYANKVKQTLCDIEAVKKRIIKQQEDMKKLKAEILDVIDKTKLNSDYLRTFMETSNNRLKRALNEEELNNIRNQVDFIITVDKYELEVLANFASVIGKNKSVMENFKVKLVKLMENLCKIDIGKDDFKKLKLKIEVLNLRKVFRFGRIANIIDTKVIDEMELYMNKNRTEEAIQALKKKAREVLRCQISDEEKRIVMNALPGLGRGHWYKCPNGHYYAIGECGGAMQKSVCPECKEEIGGEHHQLLSTNRKVEDM